MSAPLKLNAYQLRNVADFLDAMSKARMATGVSVTPFAPANCSIDDTPFDVSWNADLERYEIDDRIGR